MKLLLGPFVYWQARRGFTIIEMMVVITVIGILSTMGIYGFQKYNNDQPVVNARDEFIANFREIQQKVNSGADGLSVRRLGLVDTTNGSANYYVIGGMNGSDSVLRYLPNGVTYTKNIITPADPNSSSWIVVCFVPAPFTAFASGMVANGCGWGGTSTSWGACTGVGCSTTAVFRNSWWEDVSTSNGMVVFDVIFSNGSSSRVARVEVSGIRVARVYVP